MSGAIAQHPVATIFIALGVVWLIGNYVLLVGLRNHNSKRAAARHRRRMVIRSQS